MTSCLRNEADRKYSIDCNMDCYIGCPPQKGRHVQSIMCNMQCDMKCDIVPSVLKIKQSYSILATQIEATNGNKKGLSVLRFELPFLTKSSYVGFCKITVQATALLSSPPKKYSQDQPKSAVGLGGHLGNLRLPEALKYLLQPLEVYSVELETRNKDQRCKRSANVLLNFCLK